MITERPLPMTVTLRPQETAFSYMSRLAARNELSAVDFGRYTGVTFTKVLRGDSEIMMMLASRGGIDCHDLLKWSGKIGQRAKMYPTLMNGYENDEATELFRQV